MNIIVDPVEGEKPAWGQESQVFVNNINLLIQVGGGVQSHEEAALARARGISVLYFAIPEL
jgi:hypothetical protein